MALESIQGLITAVGWGVASWLKLAKAFLLLGKSPESRVGDAWWKAAKDCHVHVGYGSLAVRIRLAGVLSKLGKGG